MNITRITISFVALFKVHCSVILNFNIFISFDFHVTSVSFALLSLPFSDHLLRHKFRFFIYTQFGPYKYALRFIYTTLDSW